MRVRGGERFGHFSRDPDRVANWKLALALQTSAERLSLHVRHHIVQQPIRVSGIQQREDMRMLQLGGRLDLAEETLTSQRRRQLRMQDLDGYVAIMFDVLREI